MKNIKIFESSINRILSHTKDKDIAMITAFRTDPKIGRSLTENRIENKKLESDLNLLGYKGYIKVVGYWNETPEVQDATPVAEETFLVLNVGNSSFDDFVEDMVGLAAKYNQQGIIVWNHKENIAKLFDSIGNVVTTFSSFNIDNIAQGWTQIKGHKIIFNEALDNHKFSDHFNEDGNFMTAIAYESLRKRIRKRKDNNCV